MAVVENGKILKFYRYNGIIIEIGEVSRHSHEA